jgi:hypothetical protein
MSTCSGDAVGCLAKEEVDSMLYAIAIVLLVLWALGFLAFHIGGGLIHALIVLAVILFLFQALSGRRSIA